MGIRAGYFSYTFSTKVLMFRGSEVLGWILGAWLGLGGDVELIFQSAELHLKW